MTETMSAGGRSRGTDQDEVIVGGFGWPEQPARTEPCPQDNCDHSKTLATDLFCGSHDRFLPFAQRWTTGSRRASIVAGAALIYGCFALAAQSGSWLPVFLVYALIGLAVVGLPLRVFPTTVRVAVAVWLVACAATLIYHFTGPHSRAIMVTALLITAACGLGLDSGINSVQQALHGGLVTSKHQRPSGVLAFVAGTLV